MSRGQARRGGLARVAQRLQGGRQAPGSPPISDEERIQQAHRPSSQRGHAWEPGGWVGDRRYELVRRLGHGSYGEAWLARERATGANVVLKSPFPGSAAELLERFGAEVEVQAGLGHGGILGVLEDRFTRTRAERPFVVLPWCEGGAWLAEGATLFEAMGRVELGRFLGWLCQGVEALGYLHARQLVHCDVKPSNFLLDGARLVLGDFGLALRVALWEVRGGRLDGQDGLGTPLFQAPEQGERRSYAGPATDLYAVGAILGLYLQAHEAARSSWPAGVSRGLEDLAERLCRTRYEQRPECAADVLRELAVYTKDAGGCFAPSPATERREGEAWTLAFRRELPVWGRSGELGWLDGLLREVAASSRPCFAALEGERVGKAHLLEGFAREVLVRGEARVLRLPLSEQTGPGEGDPQRQAREADYDMQHSFRAAFLGVLRRPDLSDPERVAERLRQTLGLPSDGGEEAWLAPMVRFVRSVPRTHVGPQGSQERRRTLSAFEDALVQVLWRMTQAPTARPLVILVTGGDEPQRLLGTLLLGRILPRLAGLKAPVLLVWGSRPVSDREALLCAAPDQPLASRFERRALEALPLLASRTAHHLLPWLPASVLARACELDRTLGLLSCPQGATEDPETLVELLFAWCRAGIVRPEDLRARALTPEELPMSTHAHLDQRVAQLCRRTASPPERVWEALFLLLQEGEQLPRRLAAAILREVGLSPELLREERWLKGRQGSDPSVSLLRPLARLLRARMDAQDAADPQARASRLTRGAALRRDAALQALACLEHRVALDLLGRLLLRVPEFAEAEQAPLRLAALSDLARVASRQRNPEELRRLRDEIVALAPQEPEAQGDPFAQEVRASAALWGRALPRAEQSEPPASDEALDHAAPMVRAERLLFEAKLHHERRNPVAALVCAERLLEALAQARAEGGFGRLWETVWADAHHERAESLMALGRYEEARASNLAARMRFERLGDQHGEAMSSVQRLRLERQARAGARGEVEGALRAAFVQAEEQLKALQSHYDLGNLYWEQGELDEEAGRWRAAQDSYGKAQRSFALANAPLAQLQACLARCTPLHRRAAEAAARGARLQVEQSLAASREACQQARALLGSGDGVVQAQAWMREGWATLAQAYLLRPRATGDEPAIQDARRCFEHAERVLPADERLTAPDQGRPGWGSLIALGLAASSDTLAQAQEHFERARAWLQGHPLPGDDDDTREGLWARFPELGPALETLRPGAFSSPNSSPSPD